MTMSIGLLAFLLVASEPVELRVIWVTNPSSNDLRADSPAVLAEFAAAARRRFGQEIRFVPAGETTVGALLERDTAGTNRFLAFYTAREHARLLADYARAEGSPLAAWPSTSAYAWLPALAATPGIHVVVTNQAFLGAEIARIAGLAPGDRAQRRRATAEAFAHELGHALRDWAEHYGHPGCIMNPCVGTDLARWARGLADTPCGRPHRTNEGY